ncbi:tetratricopeptide repeat protein [Flavihumibacter profundi]|uniref:tetratricopeptide repeat protein n=1 Tax=Flavihumibacter profundi TaxID=2716883 RepID=UPI001CC70593|nr:tetratricopeptide repeat protein [Flavihumibacter profundi]MBZ5856581.1 tetratricopeptide repeat protein [Flavihumibacter profundi]
MKSLFAGVMLVVFMVDSGCRSRDSSSSEKTASTNIFQQAQFSGISDSIKASPKEPALYIRRAEMLSHAGEYELAYADLMQAWNLAPSEPLGEQRVNTLFMMGKAPEAQQVLKELMSKYGNNMNLKRRMAEALQQNKQYDEAIQTYTGIIGEDSLDFEAYHERALIYLEKKDTAAAQKDLEKSFALQPLQLTAITLANLYAESKNPRALVLADMIIARDSAKEMIDPVFIKGVYYANVKNYNKALEQFSTCIGMDWKFQEAYIEKGIIYFDQKNLDEALKQFKLAATVSNTFPDAYYWQGRCYEQLGLKEEALACYTRAYALDKNFKEAVEAAARVKSKK